MTPIQTSVIAAFRDSLRSERGNAVRDRLDTGERDRARREPAQQREQPERPDRRRADPELLAQRHDLGGRRFFVTSANEIVGNGCRPNRLNSCASPQPTNPVSTTM